MSSPPVPRVLLGLPGLPEPAASLEPGQVYVVSIDGQTMRVPLVAQALAATLDAGGTCTVVTPGDPAAFLAKARLCGLALQPHVDAGDLNVVRQRADPLLPLFRAGPAAVLEAVARLVPPGRALLLVEGAEPMLFLSEAAQAVEAGQLLRDWAREHGAAVLLVVSPASRPAREAMVLRIVAEDCAGFATVRERERGARLDLHHWFGPGGASPRLSVPLRAAAQGRWVADPGAPSPAPAHPEATLQVVAVQAALDDPVAAVRDAGWAVVSSTAQAVEAARSLPAGAIVLVAERDTAWRALGQAIVSIRRQATAWVAVVVRERGIRLRLGQQVALARLGLSCVVPESADDADLAQVLRGLAGTAFTRPVADDADAALAAASAMPAPQLMVTRAFRELVAEALASAAHDDATHALLHVACDPAKAQQLGTLALQRRVRDCALAVDPSGLWMFLFGCPPARALKVAERVFGRHHPGIAGACTVTGTPGAIARRVEQLANPVGTPAAEPAVRGRLQTQR